MSEVSIDFTVGGEKDLAVHRAFWNDPDNWLSPARGRPREHDSNVVSWVFPDWMAACLDPAKESTWESKISGSTILDPSLRILGQQEEAIVRHYGDPIPALTVYHSFACFGSRQVPHLDGVSGGVIYYDYWFRAFALMDLTFFWNLKGGEGVQPFHSLMARAFMVGEANDKLLGAFIPSNEERLEFQQRIVDLSDNDLREELRNTLFREFNG